jgi:hypothetical protein
MIRALLGDLALTLSTAWQKVLADGTVVGGVCQASRGVRSLGVSTPHADTVRPLKASF